MWIWHSRRWGHLELAPVAASGEKQWTVCMDRCGDRRMLFLVDFWKPQGCLFFQFLETAV